MKSFGLIAVLAAALMAAPGVYAQQSSAPAGSTGQCNDGTYTSAASKRGACHGHQGVQTWFSGSSGSSSSNGGSSSTSSNSNTTSSNSTSASGSKSNSMSSSNNSMSSSNNNMSSSKSSGVSTTPAAGGGPGMVWVNTASKTKAYHCQGDKYYGTTKQGQYMTKSQAEAQGYHAAKNSKACS